MPGPNDIAKALTGRPHLSYSEVKTYQSCPLRWHFQYVRKHPPEVLSAAMLLGTCVHAAIQHHFEAFLSLDAQPTLQQLMKVYQQKWQDESRRAPIQFARDQNADELAATAERMIDRFLLSPYSKITGDLVGIEEDFKASMAPDLPDLAGRVDMITIENNHLVITDFKTARTLWADQTADDNAEQLLIYAKGCKPIAKELGVPIQLRFVVITKAKEPKIEAVPVKLTPQRLDRTQLVIRRVFQSMQVGQVYPVPSVMNCTGCAHRNRCERWHLETEP